MPGMLDDMFIMLACWAVCAATKSLTVLVLVLIFVAAPMLYCVVGFNFCLVSDSKLAVEVLKGGIKPLVGVGIKEYIYPL